ncbi:hypothetical protein MVEN_01874800 [Mycena venus]|uniref:F-box domain-containing protein n=1 Tax=Mycena venus TaxID=2733690 RepID=A0A8H7CN41_9AGAR|nr:hypothetical protein MVEN_01874800 [Mycena venus]
MPPSRNHILALLPTNHTFTRIRRQLTFRSQSGRVPACSLLPQELWDKILNLLSFWDLKSSALVCRAFVARAQMTLFRCMKVGVAHWYFDPPMITGNQLAELLARSPHLIEYICELKIRCDEETLVPIVRIPWSRLSSVSLTRDIVEEETLDLLITSLVSLPSLRAVRFGFWEANDLRKIITSCSPSVVCLGLTSLSPGTLFPSYSEVSLPKQRPSITHLELSYLSPSSPILALLLDPACPFDFSGLKNMKLECLMGGTLSAVLHPFQQTIENLEFNVWDDSESCESLNFSSFPVLSHISIGGTKETVIPLHRALERSRRNGIRTICYPNFLPFMVDLMPTFESCILAGDMPELQMVEVRPRNSWEEEDRPTSGKAPRSKKKQFVFRPPIPVPSTYSDAEWTSIIEEKMPRLVERGILVITFG